jgi:hypothetical protein
MESETNNKFHKNKQRIWNTMFPMIVATRNAGRSTSALAIRNYSRSVALRAEPTLHNATGKWEELKSKRPYDEDDHHVS